MSRQILAPTLADLFDLNPRSGWTAIRVRDDVLLLLAAWVSGVITSAEVGEVLSTIK